jgi:branched-chain amino acid transport system substrate-binding protein
MRRPLPVRGAAKSVAAVEKLAAEGVQVAVGPEKSSEIAAVRTVADKVGVIVISPGSTASSLALPGDNVFRLAPDDRSEGAAMVALLRRQAIKAVVPVWRDDAGHAGLVTSMRKLFHGTVTAGAQYGESEKDFTATVARAASRVRALRARGKRVGVYLAAFDEAVGLFRMAAGNARACARCRGTAATASRSRTRSSAILRRRDSHRGPAIRTPPSVSTTPPRRGRRRSFVA